MLGVLRTGGRQINACGFDGAVAQHIGQSNNILTGPVEDRGKEMPKIVREYFSRLHSCVSAQLFHLRPDLTAAQASSASGEKDLTGDDLFHFGVFSVACGRAFAAVRLSSLALHGDLCHACPGSLHRDIPHLVAPDASSADCLYQQCQAVPAEARIAASMAFTDSSRYSRPDSPSSRRTTVPW